MELDCEILNHPDKQPKHPKTFFNIKFYLKQLKQEWPCNEDMILIINSKRNIGKSTDVWSLLVEYWEKTNYKKKVAITRTNFEKLKKSKSSFNNNFRNRFIIENESIYKVFFDEESGKELSEKRIHIGQLVDLNNEDNYRSGAGDKEGISFQDFHILFWDEFNEKAGIKSKNSNKDMYRKFMNLLSTVKRNNKPFLILLIGNKIDANNDIYTSYELDTTNHNTNYDYYQNIKHPITGEVLGYYIDIGQETFKHLPSNEDIVSKLAAFNEDTNRLFNEGGFMEKGDDDIAYYYRDVFHSKKPICYFSLGENVFEYGSFIFNKIKSFYFHKVNSINKELQILSLDITNYVKLPEAKALDKNDIIAYTDFWGMMSKQKKLYYTSFSTKLEIDQHINVISSFYK